MKEHSSSAQTHTRGRHWLARLTSLALLAALAVASASAAPGVARPGGKRGLDTFTANLYVGSGIERIVALDPADPLYLSNLVFTVTGVYYELLASQPPVRMQAVADRIAERMPDLVAVEEASLVRNHGDLLLGGTTPATNVVFDYLELLVDSLAARGAHYTVVSTSDELDVELPMLNLQTGLPEDARLTDREAILARTDLPPGQLRVSNPQHDNFANFLEVSGIKILRGWCSVDVTIRGQSLRYICAHLEEETAPQLQLLQAAELLAGPADVTGPVVICGDFNADPLHRDGSTAYDAFPAAGFGDTWAALHPDNLSGGLTWGHDEFLADPSNAFDRRIDFVFYRGPRLIPSYADVLDMSLDRTEPPLWASDHAALSAGFVFQPAPKAIPARHPSARPQPRGRF